MSANIFNGKFHINLNEQQTQAVKHTYGPALVLAGPGSGKTTVITARIAYLVSECKVNPGSILTLTFNKAARAEMEYRYKKNYGSDIGERVHFATLHSFCRLVMRDYEIRQGKRFKLIEGEEKTEDNKRKVIRTLYQQINNSKINDDELENLISEIGFVKNKMIKDFENIKFGTKNFSLIFKAYEDYKRSNLYIDFDDMLTYAYSILIRCPDILDYYRAKYAFIQVDEGQDLSKIQFEILKLIVNPECNNIFIVADDDQSIYGFRGAEPQYILNIKNQFKDCYVYLLENNYRSTKNIVDISSNFIKENNWRFDKNHKTDNAAKLDPIIVQARDEGMQLTYLLEKLKLHEEEGKSIAILYRNNLSSIVIADELDRKGISFRLKQNKLSFFTHWIVLDILAFFKFALDPFNEEAFSRIYYKMNRYISKTMLEHALNGDKREHVIDRILKDAEIKPFQQNKLLELKIEFAKLAKKSPVLAMDYIERGFNYFEYVKEYCENTGLTFDYLYRMFGILVTLAEGCMTIPEFLERLEELRLLFETPRELGYKNVVTLTTMHSSKGLEYDAVFMIDLTEAEIPGSNVVDQARKDNDYAVLEEERRLFYVGMTRAREYLYLISPGSKASRSTFVKEVEQLMRSEIVNQIGEGMIIFHKHFGEGIVVAVLEEKSEQVLLEIDFKGVRRKLDLGVCIDNGLIVL